MDIGIPLVGAMPSSVERLRGGMHIPIPAPGFWTRINADEHLI